MTIGWWIDLHGNNNMQILTKIKTELCDYIFPIFCAGCQKEGDWICVACANLLTKKERIEFYNEKNTNLKIIFSALSYDENSVYGKALKIFKYEFVKEIYSCFEKIIEEYFFERKKYFSNVDLIIPIPLHPRRYAERGFNQAEVIAKTIARVLGKKVCLDLLYRVKYTKNQAKLSKIEREKNIKNAFEIDKKSFKNCEKILLVDDVFTTGGTLSECARTLLKSKKTNIYGFTLFRG